MSMASILARLIPWRAPVPAFRKPDAMRPKALTLISACGVSVLLEGCRLDRDWSSVNGRATA